jgi:hypothetical protein
METQCRRQSNGGSIATKSFLSLGIRPLDRFHHHLRNSLSEVLDARPSARLYAD